jgi:hypothetical protein
MTGNEPADRIADVLAAAERAGFTGAIYGPAAFNPGDDRGIRQVFIYRRGACTDRYVTTVGRQDPDLPATTGTTPCQETRMPEAPGSWTHSPLPATPHATRNALVAAYCDAYDQARAIALHACE